MRKINKRGARVCNRDGLNHFVSCKHSAEMAIGTIIVIILALIVLVILIFGFATGWGNLWDKIKALFGGNTVETIVQACTVACSSNAKYDYCTRDRVVDFGKDSVIPGLDSGKITLKCKDLEDSKYGTGLSCPSMDCPAVVLVKCTDLKSPEGKSGDWKTSAECKINENTIETNKVTDEADKTANLGKVCCVPKDTCTDLVGTWEDNACNTFTPAKTDKTNIVTQADKGTKKYCCI